MAEIISRPKDNVVLIPLHLCAGVNFSGIRFKQVTYKYEAYIIAEYGISVCQRLALKGIEVGSPILHDYHWPSMYPIPFEHQKDTADFLVRNPRCYCFNAIGTSKTLTALWAADYLMHRGDIKKVLITSTLSTLWHVWEHEIFVNLMPRTSTVLHGAFDRRIKRLNTDVDYYIINHDGLKLLQSELIAAKFDLIIVDEGAEFKNSSTDLWKAANAICGIKSGCKVWWMTGAPMPKAPTDAWAQARIVNPDNVPPYFSRFRELTMTKVNMYKWVPKRGWRDIVYACLKPAIRYTREQCLDLPPVMYVDHVVPMSKEQGTAYESLRKNLVVQLDEGLVTAVNEGAMRSKLLQIACLTGDTEVLTDSGWKQLINLLPTDLLWDGEAWTSYDGLLDNGIMDTINCWGVQMTLDHKLLTDQGWKEAQEIKNGESSHQFNRADFQLPNGYKEGGFKTYRQGIKRSSFMGVQVHLWGSADPIEPKHTQEKSYSQKLWMYAWRRCENTWTHIHSPSIQSLGQNTQQMYIYIGQRLQKLRRSRHKNVFQMERLFAVCGRYGQYIQARFNAGPQGQRQGIYAEQLSMGDNPGAGKQHTSERENPNPQRCADCVTSSTPVPHKTRNHIPKDKRRLDQGWQGRVTKNRVYDILNAGDNSRFLIRNKQGEMFLSHNCGAVYDGNGEHHFVDVAPKLAELKAAIAESGDKIIIFVPFKHTIKLIKKWLDSTCKHLTYGIVNGDVGTGARNKIFDAFQNDSLNIILAHPAAMAHGLTLTATYTILWWGPIDDYKIYDQANGRITRPGQTSKQYIKHLICSNAERVIYQRLKTKETVQASLLDMIQK